MADEDADPPEEDGNVWDADASPDAEGSPNGNDWDADDYEDAHAFVYEYGESLVDLLDPQPGERVLDLGCGTGHLTAEIDAAVGPDGEAVGVDAAPDMIAQARERHPDVRFERADATAYDPEDAFDAVFSNAALHWMGDQRPVAATVADCLVPGGRFVAEMGGTGNVGSITDAVLAELDDRGYDGEHPWTFPSVGQQATALEAAGLEVRYARLFDRPTELDGREGLREWLEMFGDDLLAPVSGDEQDAVIEAVEDRLRPEMYNPDREVWEADYRRLRFVAVRA